MAANKRMSIMPLVALIVLVGAGWGASQAGWFGAEEEVALEGVAVVRGDLRISECLDILCA